MAKGIFISYRRDDARADARSICDRLRRTFGRDAVFIDIDSIKPGQDFRTVLDHYLSRSQVVLVIIGSRWLDVRDPTGRRRLDDPEDWVRLEVARSLQRKILTIPVVLDGASLPRSSELPQDLASLANCQKITISHESFARDVAHLDAKLKEALGDPARKLWLATGAMAIGVVIAAVAGLAVWSNPPEPSRDQPIVSGTLPSLTWTKQAKTGESPREPAPQTKISAKKPGAAVGAPTSIGLEEVVKGRIGDGQDHFWRIEAPAGTYRLVFDAKNADDTATGLIISVSGSAGGKEADLVAISDNQFKQRGVAEFEIPEGGLTLRVGGAWELSDYWLAVTPVDAPVAVPYFHKTPAVTPLVVGMSATATLTAGAPDAWFSTALETKDYKVTAEFTRTDKAQRLSADLTMFGAIGEITTGPTELCSVIENAATATCTSKLVVGRDGPVTLRVTARWQGDYTVTFRLDPIDD